MAQGKFDVKDFESWMILRLSWSSSLPATLRLTFLEWLLLKRFPPLKFDSLSSSCEAPALQPRLTDLFLVWLMLKVFPLSSLIVLAVNLKLLPPSHPATDWLTDQPTVNSARLHLLLPRPLLPCSSFHLFLMIILVDSSVWDLSVL